MSTSVLHHTFGIRDHYYYESTDFIGGATIFKISRKLVPFKCPRCNEKKGILRGVTKRLIQTVPAGFWNRREAGRGKSRGILILCWCC